MSAVSGSAFSFRQNVMPSTSGRATSSTITSGRCASMRLLGLGGCSGLVHVDVDDLECRAKEHAEVRLVVDNEQPQRSPILGGAVRLDLGDVVGHGLELRRSGAWTLVIAARTP